MPTKKKHAYGGLPHDEIYASPGKSLRPSMPNPAFPRALRSASDNDVLLMSTLNICLQGEIRKISPLKVMGNLNFLPHLFKI